MRDGLGHVLYVGKAKNLKKRVSSYFQGGRKRLVQQPKVLAMLDLIEDIETIEVKSEAEALVLEDRLIKEWKPKYNTLLTDDKRFLMVRVDYESEFPVFRLTRNRTDPHSRYYGPFVYGGPLRKTLQQMRLKYGVLLGKIRPKKIGENLFRLYEDVRAEIYGHPNELSSEDYRQRVDKACALLEGKAREWLSELKQEMQEASVRRDYEKATQLRDIIIDLEGTVQPRRKFKHDPRILKTATLKQTLSELKSILDLKKIPEHIECFDISHISGTFVVASMVHFTHGKPDRAKYRRYKIRSFVGNDDYRAMEEVIGRRYRRLHKEGIPFPDVVLIDGGQGQVSAALKAFLMLNLNPPLLVGLAKKAETLVFPDERLNLNLPPESLGLQLLQRLRDEAHRFANQFNADLRSKRIRESILDEFPGLGPKRKQLLLDHFKDLNRLKRASVKDLQAVSGIGPKFAQQLHDFFKSYINH